MMERQRLLGDWGLSERKRGRLEKAIEIYNSSSGVKRFFYGIPIIHIGGVLREKYQSEICSRLKGDFFKRDSEVDWWDSSKSSLLNVGVFGTLGTLSWHYGLGEGGGYLVSFIADWLDIAPKVVGNALAGYNIAQNLYRLGYVLKHKKGIASFSIQGAYMNGIYATLRHFLKRGKKDLLSEKSSFRHGS
jgi:hypothetical protein